MVDDCARALTAMTFACLAAGASCDAEELTEAIAQLKEWRAQFISIRVQSRVEESAASNASLAAAGKQSAMIELDWVWEDSGRFYDSAVCWNDGKLVVRDLRLADLRHYYPLGYSGVDRESPVPVAATIHENRLEWTSAKVRRQPFWALWDDSTRTWLSDRLRIDSGGRVDSSGMLELDGNSVGMPGFLVRLDPHHGYLPSSVEYMATSDLRYDVEDFQEIRDGIWFPKRGTIMLNHDARQTWEVTDVRLNPELPDSLFVPPLGPFTYVSNTITGKQYWHGGKPPAKKGASSGSVPDPATSSTTSSVASAAPERSTNWSLWLTGAGLVLVALAVWKRRNA